MRAVMAMLATAGRRLTAWTQRGHHARELDQELALHLDLLEADLRATGLSAAAAREAAHRQLGNRTRIAESSWDVLSLQPLDAMARDLLLTIRSARKSPGFAVTVIVTLALGIGATATVGSVLDHVLLRPLAYRDADRLVTLYQRGANGNLRLVSFPTFEDWARPRPEIAGMAYVRGLQVTLGAADGPQRAVAAFVSAGFFKVMGAGALQGRTFQPDEEATAGVGAVVLSHGLWMKAFGGDPGVIGRTVALDSGSGVVVGVMPPGFMYPSWAQLWRPLGQIVDRDPVLKRRDFHVDSRAIARLAPGGDVARATLLLAVTQQQIAVAYPDAESTWTGVKLVPLQTEVVGDVGTALWALGAAVAVVLLIACVNVANLAAVRGGSRGREIAVRLALGASRAQVARQFLVETLALAAVGGGLGVLGAVAAVAWLRRTAPFDLPRAGELAVDLPVLVAATLLTALTAVVFGVLPALRAAAPRGALGELLGGRPGAGGTRREARGRVLLTGVQFALALTLLVGAGLLVQSYRRLQAVQLGFDPRELLTLTVEPPKAKYSDPRAAFALYERLIARLRAEPGVEDAAVVNFMPLGRAGLPTRLELPGRTVSSEDLATYITVSEDYRRTMRIPLVRGRWFSSDEMRTAGDGIVISEGVARRYWPGADAVGRAITIFRSSQARADFGRAVPSVVIGVVGDVRQFGPENDADQAVYVPLVAEPWPWASVVVRARASGPGVVAALRRAVAEVEPGAVVPGSEGDRTGFQPVVQALSTVLAPRRYVLGLVTAFSVCALLLAAIGIYGVTSYTVARRTHELGIRLALGATRREIMASVLVRGLVTALAGCAAGTVGALFLVRFLEHLLYNTSVTDPVVLVTIPVLLVTVGMVASYLPARRAARVDPMIALRSD